MNKRELTALVAQQTGLTKIATLKIIDAVFESIRESLQKSESTIIQGFGSFSVAQRAERKGINPSNKQPITIPAHKVVKFSVSKKIELK